MGEHFRCNACPYGNFGLHAYCVIDEAALRESSTSRQHPPSTVNSASVFEGIPLALQPSDAGTWLFTSQGVWMGDTLGTTWLQLARPEDLSSTTSIASGTASRRSSRVGGDSTYVRARALVIDRTSDGGETWQGSSVPISEMPLPQFAPGVPGSASLTTCMAFWSLQNRSRRERPRLSSAP